MKVRDLKKLLRRRGWYHIRTRGSHHHYEHPDIPILITVPGHDRDEVKPGILNKVLKQAGLR